MYAAGDVAGGCPQKYVTGALAEGEIAALTAISELGEISAIDESDIERHLSEVTDFTETLTEHSRQNSLKRQCRPLWIRMQAVSRQIIALMKTA